MRVLVLGAGAIGGYFGGRLLDEPACDASQTMSARSSGRGPASADRVLAAATVKLADSMRIPYPNPAAAPRRKPVCFFTCQ